MRSSFLQDLAGVCMPGRHCVHLHRPVIGRRAQLEAVGAAALDGGRERIVGLVLVELDVQARGVREHLGRLLCQPAVLHLLLLVNDACTCL